MHRHSKVGVIRLMLILLVVVSICLGPLSCSFLRNRSKDNSRKRKKTETVIVEIDFPVENTTAVVQNNLAQTKAPEIEKIKEEEATKVSQQIQQYYEAAFLNPKLWKNDEFGALDSFFAPSIKDQIKKNNFDDLCLGDAAKKLEALKTVEAKIPNLWIALDKNLKPQLCAAATEAEAIFVQKSGQQAHFLSSATLYLEPEENGEWKIVDYDLKYQLKSEE